MKRLKPKDLHFNKFKLVTLILGSLVKICRGEETNTAGLVEVEPSWLGDNQRGEGRDGQVAERGRGKY